MTFGGGECRCDIGIGMSAAVVFEGPGLQNCLAELLDVIALMRLPASLCVLQKCPTRVSHKTVPQETTECPTLQECSARASNKSVLQKCPTRVSSTVGRLVFECVWQGWGRLLNLFSLFL